MEKQKVRIEQIEHKPVKKTVEVELPTETAHYFITGIRKSYKVVPRFSNWEGGDGSIFKYDVLEIGQSFECTVTTHVVGVTDIPRIHANTKHPLHQLVSCMVENEGRSYRTKEQFDADLESAMQTIKESIKE